MDHYRIATMVPTMVATMCAKCIPITPGFHSPSPTISQLSLFSSSLILSVPPGHLNACTRKLYKQLIRLLYQTYFTPGYVSYLYENLQIHWSIILGMVEQLKTYKRINKPNQIIFIATLAHL